MKRMKMIVRRERAAPVVEALRAAGVLRPFVCHVHALGRRESRASGPAHRQPQPSGGERPRPGCRASSPTSSATAFSYVARM